MIKRKIISVLLAISMAPLAAVEPVEALSKANEALLQNELIKAESILLSAIDDNPNSLALHNALARIYILEGNLNEAEETLKTAITQHSEAANLFVNLLRVNELRVSERYRRALGIEEQESVNHVMKVAEAWRFSSEYEEQIGSVSAVAASVPNEASVAIIPDNTDMVAATEVDGPTTELVATVENSDEQDTVITGGDEVAAISDANGNEVASTEEEALEVIGGSEENASEGSTTVSSQEEQGGQENQKAKAEVADTEASEDEADTGNSASESGDNEAAEEVAEEVAEEEADGEEVAEESNGEDNGKTVSGDISSIAAARIESWRSSWSARDADAYVAHYVSNYSPAADMTHDEWKEDRRDNFASKSSIEVSVEDLESNAIDDARIRVRFVQKYASNNYKDEVVKRITLVERDDTWLIEQEISSPVD